MGSSCDVKASLLTVYARATQTYSKGVADLSRAVGTILYSEYELLKIRVAIAREGSESARQQLQDHIREHCC